jgi:hypothetical protein
MAKQVRLDDEIVVALQGSEFAGGDVSLSAAANAALRDRLLPPVGARRGKASTAPVRRGCVHPVGRRIGNNCGACGAGL